MIKSGKILIHVTGSDYPGILARLTDLFEMNHVTILDVQQTTTLKQLNLSLLLSIPKNYILAILRKVHQIMREEDLTIRTTILNKEQIFHRESRYKFALTILSKDIRINNLNSLVQIIAQHNINIIKINQLAKGKLQCIELIISMHEKIFKNFEVLSQFFFKKALEQDFDLAIQPENFLRNSKRLIVMDMDSTLIQQEVIDELADIAQVKDQVASITKKTMEGDMCFNKSLSQRVALLKGLEQDALEIVKNRITLTSGAEFLIIFLKKMGFRIGVISGGFTYFTSFLQKKLDLDYSFANELEIKEGKLTGKINGEIVDRQKKAEILKKLASHEKIRLDQTIAIGDGANDLDMLSIAGLGIAFNAKLKVRTKAKASLSLPDLVSVLFLLGISEEEILANQ